ncbi:MAG: hypothetical protein HN547_11550 [Chloroflexi bacterium]|jgi:hypothetical protein|nr:hypothetical protein [Chloroflexota bacterium]MBT6152677.1 hypothetical protein [Chloroflexota bacterium]MBT6356628.1 hypothetical protein [Chloroflexota bacterium]
MIKLGIKILDDTVPTEKLHHFLDKGIQNISQTTQSSMDGFNEKDLKKIELAKNLNEFRKKPSFSPDINQFDFYIGDLEYEEVGDWIEVLPKKRVIGFKGFFPRTGEMMLWLIENKPNEYIRFFDSQIETLLRIIEIKKQKALVHNQTGYKQYLEPDRQLLSILLSRISRETKDIRFLNTALKMNDWSYPFYRRENTSPDLINYLLAVAEAEYSVKVLLS